MDTFSRKDLDQLISVRNGPCVSMFLPTAPAGEQARAGRIILKNLLSEAEGRLEARGMTAVAIDGFLKPARALVDADSFWKRQTQGLAMFLSETTLRTWFLPVKFTSTVQVDDQFYIKPLLPLVDERGDYLLLAVSEKQVGLYRGNRLGLTRLDAKTLPNSLAEALNYHQPEGTFQVRSLHSGGNGAGGRGKSKEAAVFHGQGNADHKKDDLLAYFRVIDRALHDTLRDERVPLVFAGVEHLFPIYRQANSYAHLWPEAVHGNPDNWNAVELHERAAAVVEPYWRQALAEDESRIHARVGSERVSSDIEQILPAAYDGQVEAIFVASDAEVWGTYDESTRRVRLALRREVESRDLLDLAAAATLARKGRAHAVPARELPAGIALTALLRYAEERPTAALRSTEAL